MEANVITVHRKDNRSQPSNYSTILLRCCYGKLKESCMHKHIYDYRNQKHVISSYQLGFESGDSTINQPVDLSNKFLQALDEGKEIRVVFCDVSKAFDIVWHKSLLFKQKSVAFSTQLLEWFSSYLSNRRQRVCFKGFNSSWLHINAGVPYGSILGPLLFVILKHDVVKCIRGNAAIEFNFDLKNTNSWYKKGLFILTRQNCSILET